jgi:hypothetical protein
MLPSQVIGKKPKWFLFTKGDWKKATVVPIYKGGDQSAVSKYGPISLTSVICKRLEHIVGGYLRQVWDENDWLYEGQHGV